MRFRLSHTRIFSAALLLAFFAGCATGSRHESVGPTVESAPRIAAPPVYVPPPPAEGSLFTDSAAMLFTDDRAYRVGDTVVVDIVENTSSTMAANTKADRATTVDAGITHALGYLRWLENANRNLGKDSSDAQVNKLFAGEFTNEFEGKATSDRSGQVTASIGARVVEVLPNGNLIIFGKREMRVNEEVQYVSVAGVARPRDISSDNRIQSTYLADSRIEYSGRGVLAEKQKPGWGARILDKIFPF